MKPQKQLFRHRPKDGIYGDCHRTAIAIVLDMDAKDVPHFMHGGVSGDEAADLAEAWLNERGIATINVVYGGQLPVSDVLATVDLYNRRSRPVFLLTGKSCNGTGHVVVCSDGKIACDPALDDSGIVGPCDDGFYWVTFFAHLDATADPYRRRSAVAIERERMEDVAASLARILTMRGAHPEDFAITLGHGELHIYAPCPEVQWEFPKPSKVDGYPIDWHFGAVGLAREVAG